MPEYHPPEKHYERGAIQPIDYIEATFSPAEFRGYLKGNIIKYLARYQLKGTPEADLSKARVYLTWLIEFERKQASKELEAK